MEFVLGWTANIDRGPSSNGNSNYANTVAPANAHINPTHTTFITQESPWKPTERLDTLIRENKNLLHDKEVREHQIETLLYDNRAPEARVIQQGNKSFEIKHLHG